MAIGEIERYREVTLLNSEGAYYLLTSVAGTKAKFAPGYQPVIIKAWAVQHLTTLAYTVTVTVGLYQNTSPGLSATGNYNLIDSIALTTGAGSDTGQVFFSSPSPATLSMTLLYPGQEAVAHILAAGSTSTASESHAVRVTMYFEPTYQNPGDNSNMTAA